jgi:uncharacterized protein YdhG (YjbR/CyaY superfamily)
MQKYLINTSKKDIRFPTEDGVCVILKNVRIRIDPGESPLLQSTGGCYFGPIKTVLSVYPECRVIEVFSTHEECIDVAISSMSAKPRPLMSEDYLKEVCAAVIKNYRVMRGEENGRVLE